MKTVLESLKITRFVKNLDSPDWESKVDTARSMNLLDVAQLLGIELEKEAASKIFEAL